MNKSVVGRVEDLGALLRPLVVIMEGREVASDTMGKIDWSSHDSYLHHT